jgi:hypothetical protein
LKELAMILPVVVSVYILVEGSLYIRLADSISLIRGAISGEDTSNFLRMFVRVDGCSRRNKRRSLLFSEKVSKLNRPLDFMVITRYLL